MGMKQKKNFFEKKFKMADSKKLSYSATPKSWAIVAKISQKFFFASFLFKLVTIYGVPRIFRNFDDYPDFQQKSRGL